MLANFSRKKNEIYRLSLLVAILGGILIFQFYQYTALDNYFRMAEKKLYMQKSQLWKKDNND